MSPTHTFQMLCFQQCAFCSACISVFVDDESCMLLDEHFMLFRHAISQLFQNVEASVVCNVFIEHQIRQENCSEGPWHIGHALVREKLTNGGPLMGCHKNFGLIMPRCCDFALLQMSVGLKKVIRGRSASI